MLLFLGYEIDYPPSIMRIDMYYVPDGTIMCGFYECEDCGERFLDVKVIVKLPDRKRRSNGSYTRADAECDEEIECWLRNIASATRAYLESDEYSYNDEHELLLEYRCWG